MSDYQKYLKYKTKYLNLKYQFRNQMGGNPVDYQKMLTDIKNEMINIQVKFNSYVQGGDFASDRGNYIKPLIEALDRLKPLVEKYKNGHPGDDMMKLGIDFSIIQAIKVISCNYKKGRVILQPEQEKKLPTLKAKAEDVYQIISNTVIPGACQGIM
jgi:hypothetical protein